MDRSDRPDAPAREAASRAPSDNADAHLWLQTKPWTESRLGGPSHRTMRDRGQRPRSPTHADRHPQSHTVSDSTGETGPTEQGLTKVDVHDLGMREISQRCAGAIKPTVSERRLTKVRPVKTGVGEVDTHKQARSGEIHAREVHVFKGRLVTTETGQACSERVRRTNWAANAWRQSGQKCVS